MPSFWSSLNLLAAHVWLGVVAALLFVVGLATAGPVVRHDYRPLIAPPVAIVRLVLRIIGPELRAWRLFLTIFVFNTTAIALYMLSGVLLVLPGAIAFLTGVSIGVIMLKAGEIEPGGGQRLLAPAGVRDDGSPAPWWTHYCGLVVLALELPSFWIAVGMGIGMARRLSAPGAYTLANMKALVAERLHAYWMIVIPALFISALAETAAVRGHAASRRAQ